MKKTYHANGFPCICCICKQKFYLKPHSLQELAQIAYAVGADFSYTVKEEVAAYRLEYEKIAKNYLKVPHYCSDCQYKEIRRIEMEG